MSSTVLLVANRTANTDRLREAVADRATHGASAFHLVVPAMPRGLHRVVDPEVAGCEEARAALESALPSLSEAAGFEVTGEVGSADPFAAIQDALTRGNFDEVVVSTLPRRFSRWMRVDLPSKVRGLGVPVVHVQADDVPEPALAANQ
jgi:hypothetical protein